MGLAGAFNDLFDLAGRIIPYAVAGGGAALLAVYLMRRKNPNAKPVNNIISEISKRAEEYKANREKQRELEYTKNLERVKFYRAERRALQEKNLLEDERRKNQKKIF